MKGDFGRVFVDVPTLGEFRNRRHRLRVKFDESLEKGHVDAGFGLAAAHLRVKRLRLRTGDVAEDLAFGRLDLPEELSRADLRRPSGNEECQRERRAATQ